MTNLIYQYKKDKNGNPYGCVVAKKVDSLHFRVGWSKKCKKDVFDKKMGLLIAQGRADKNSVTPVPDDLYLDVCEMESRAARYFQGLKLESPVKGS